VKEAALDAVVESQHALSPERPPPADGFHAMSVTTSEPFSADK